MIPVLFARSGKSFDQASLAYFAAAGITDSTQKVAYDNLVKTLKAAGIYSKMFAIYPFLGGTASSHKWNAVNPLDTNAAFRLSFNGGWTHRSTGASPNGTTGYADTFFVPSTSGFTATSGSIGIYSRTNALGGYDFSVENSICVIIRYAPGNLFFSYAGLTPAQANTDSRGFFCTNRNGVSNTEGFTNGYPYIVNANAVSLPASALVIGADRRTGTPTEFASREYAFAYISQGLTILEQWQLYKAVQRFQTDLGRQVDSYYEKWLAKASTYGTITTKERTAMQALFSSLTSNDIIPYMYSLYCLGGDDAAFSTTANRRDKRAVNVIRPTEVATWVASAGLTLSAQGMTTGGSDYATAATTPSSYAGFVKSNIGLTWGIATAAGYSNVHGGYGTSNIYLATGSTGAGDIWGNQPNGAGFPGTPTGQFTSVSTTTIGTGIRSYRNGALVGSGANGSAIPNMAATPLHLLWNQPAGGAGHTGITYLQADHQALTAAQVANLHTAMSAYYSAMA